MKFRWQLALFAYSSARVSLCIPGLVFVFLLFNMISNRIFLRVHRVRHASSTTSFMVSVTRPLDQSIARDAHVKICFDFVRNETSERSDCYAKCVHRITKCVRMKKTKRSTPCVCSILTLGGFGTSAKESV